MEVSGDNLEDIMGEHWGQLSFVPLTERVQQRQTLNNEARGGAGGVREETLETRAQDVALVSSYHRHQQETVGTEEEESRVNLTPGSLLSTGVSVRSHGVPTKRVKFQLEEEKFLNDDVEGTPDVATEGPRGAVPRMPTNQAATEEKGLCA